MQKTQLQTHHQKEKKNDGSLLTFDGLFSFLGLHVKYILSFNGAATVDPLINSSSLIAVLPSPVPD